MTPAEAAEPETTIALAVTANAVASDPAAMALWQHLDVGAPVNVIFWVIVGAGAGVWNKRIKHKGNLAGAFFASFILTIGVVVGIPHVSGWHWDSAGLQAAMGLLLAFTSQNWGPKFLQAIDRIDLADALRNSLANWLRPPPRSGNDDPR